jgi:hypothetical protein
LTGSSTAVGSHKTAIRIHCDIRNFNIGLLARNLITGDDKSPFIAVPNIKAGALTFVSVIRAD